MGTYRGRIQGQALEPTMVTIQLEDGRFRMVAGTRRLGSWTRDEVEVERTGIYRFSIRVEGEEFEFHPEQPSEFSNGAGAVIDLRDGRGRFGLAARIREASN